MLPVHKIPRMDHTALNKLQCASNRARSVMETRQQREIGIVDKRRIERNRRAARATSKEIHLSALAHEMNAGFPGLRTPHRFNHHVVTRLACLAHFSDQPITIADVDNDEIIADTNDGDDSQSATTADLSTDDFTDEE